MEVPLLNSLEGETEAREINELPRAIQIMNGQVGLQVGWGGAIELKCFVYEW